MNLLLRVCAPKCWFMKGAKVVYMIEVATWQTCAYSRTWYDVGAAMGDATASRVILQQQRALEGSAVAVDWLRWAPALYPSEWPGTGLECADGDRALHE